MKEKVIPQVVYISEDGKQFYNKEDCIAHELQCKYIENIFKYVSFYDCTKKQIVIEPELKTALIQYYCTDEIKNSKYYDIIEDFYETLCYIHISKDIPIEFENDIKKFMYNFCIDLLEITRFDFAKGITYFYDNEIECFSNTEYEREKIQSQIELLMERESFE